MGKHKYYERIGRNKPVKTSSLFVITGPSGVGKTTALNILLDKYDDIYYPLTHTTRDLRKDEVAGADIIYRTHADWINDFLQGEFIAVNEIHGEYYGTKKKDVLSALQSKKKVVMILDEKGADDIRASGLCTVFIFLAPETFQSLETNLRKRWPNGGDLFHQRLDHAIRELKAQDQYDYVIRSDNIDRLVLGLEQLIFPESED